MPTTTPGNDRSLAQMFFDRSRAAGPRAALRLKQGNGFVDVAFATQARRVEIIAAGLLSIPGGLAERATVGIFAGTRAEWLAIDFAALSLGAITVPIYATLLMPEVGYLHVDAGIEVLFCEGKEQLEKARAMRQGFKFLEKDYAKERVKLRHIVVIDPKGVDVADDWESLADLQARGERELAATRSERERRTQALTRDDVATYSYTSGTTGAPKGVIQTHGNWLSLLDVASDMDIFTEGTKETGVFLFLPLAHAFGRLIGFGAAYFETVVILSSMDTLLDDLTGSRPGFLPSAPRMYEKIYARLMSGVAAAPPRRQKLFARAIAIGKRTIPYRQKKQPLPTLLRVQHAIADRLVLSKIRARLGLDRTESMLTGSAPLAPAVHEFFFAIGLTLIEAYGLTETCPGISANRPDHWKLGTVGPLLKNIQLKFEPDGEICVKGPNVTRGYLNRDDANAEAFDKDGWFHTGDIGELDGEGFLRITDRKKDLLKTSGGKYIAPQKIEGLMKARPLITEAVVIGDNKKYCTALIVVDDDVLKQWADRTGNAADRSAPATLAFLQEQIAAVNADLASFESIKYFRVVPESFTVQNGMLTASFKVKRKSVSVRWAALIEEMYASSSSSSSKEAA
ncbi:MAG: long-chain fatty acid--CoA ligase [Deltaproteobacteria bacterium]|nr:long-chain fatty acid--CoA ligase [Deltaproteobacteria bacterium]